MGLDIRTPIVPATVAVKPALMISPGNSRSVVTLPNTLSWLVAPTLACFGKSVRRHTGDYPRHSFGV